MHMTKWKKETKSQSGKVPYCTIPTIQHYRNDNIMETDMHRRLPGTGQGLDEEKQRDILWR